MRASLRKRDPRESARRPDAHAGRMPAVASADRQAGAVALDVAIGDVHPALPGLADAAAREAGVSSFQTISGTPSTARMISRPENARARGRRCARPAPAKAQAAAGSDPACAADSGAEKAGGEKGRAQHRASVCPLDESRQASRKTRQFDDAVPLAAPLLLRFEIGYVSTHAALQQPKADGGCSSCIEPDCAGDIGRIGKTIEELNRYGQQWLAALPGCTCDEPSLRTDAALSADRSGRFRAQPRSAADAGAMFPSDFSRARALVVVLHGCQQTAEG